MYGNYSLSTYGNYLSTLNSYTSSWNATTRGLLTSDIIKIISHDIFNSTLNSSQISPQIIGDIESNNDYNSLINKARTFNGSFSFMNNKFSYLASNICYWADINEQNQYGYTVIRNNENTSVITAGNENTTCNVIPVIIANKNDL